jgi:hypothetical protein
MFFDVLGIIIGIILLFVSCNPVENGIYQASIYGGPDSSPKREPLGD